MYVHGVGKSYVSRSKSGSINMNNFYDITDLNNTHGDLAVAAWTVAGTCVDDCSVSPLGYYQSCDGCGMFVACVWG